MHMAGDGKFCNSSILFGVLDIPYFAVFPLLVEDFVSA